MSVGDVGGPEGGGGGDEEAVGAEAPAAPIDPEDSIPVGAGDEPGGAEPEATYATFGLREEADEAELEPRVTESVPGPAEGLPEPLATEAVGLVAIALELVPLEINTPVLTRASGLETESCPTAPGMAIGTVVVPTTIPGGGVAATAGGAASTTGARENPTTATRVRTMVHHTRERTAFMRVKHQRPCRP